MNWITDRIADLWPEMTLLIGACLCMLTGLSASRGYRKLPAWITAGSLLTAAWLVWTRAAREPGTGQAIGIGLIPFVKLAIAGVGLLLALLATQAHRPASPAGHPHTRAQPRPVFDPATVMRGEFFAFFLFSLTGAMLCAEADDLVWLFVALELTSLPTYVMVATARARVDAQEAAVKYFFLGAMAAAVFLYGFTLIYGATGSTAYRDIEAFVAAGAAGGHGTPPLLVAGLVLAIVGVSFKIAAVPMHFYAADVYQGAAVPVTAFLAFVPKTAGFVSLIGLLDLASHLDHQDLQPLLWMLWIMAVLTMTVGNVLGLLQHNVKRVLAYSSIAHSGYMLVGLVAALAAAGDPTIPEVYLGNGVAAVLFYLVAYGLATVGAFAVLGCAARDDDDEVQTFDDIAGLGRRYPVLGVIMLLSVLSLLGLPPMVGFLGKIYLFGSAIRHGYIWLVVLAVLNSAVSAVYYLRIVSACYFRPPNDQTRALVIPARWLGGAVAAVGALALGVAGNRLVDATRTAAGQRPALTDVSPRWNADLANTSVTW